MVSLCVKMGEHFVELKFGEWGGVAGDLSSLAMGGFLPSGGGSGDIKMEVLKQ